MGAKITNVVGELITVDAPKSGVAWGPFLRIRVNTDITKPLMRGKMIQTEDSEAEWVVFKYERLFLSFVIVVEFWVQIESFSNSKSSQLRPSGMKLTEENFEKPGEIGEDIEMSTTSFECTENLDLTKHSLRSWKRIIRGDMVLNSNQSPSLKVWSSKRHVENHDPNHSAELHPHQKKTLIIKLKKSVTLLNLLIF